MSKVKVVVILVFLVVAFTVLGMFLKHDKETSIANDGVAKVLYSDKSVNALHGETIDLIENEDYKYVTVPSKIEQHIKAKKDMFVYAFSPTCIHCKNLTPYMVDIMKDKNLDNVYYLNLLEYPALFDEYAIEGTPTMIHYKDGKEVDRFVGDIGKDEVTKFFEKEIK